MASALIITNVTEEEWVDSQDARGIVDQRLIASDVDEILLKQRPMFERCGPIVEDEPIGEPVHSVEVVLDPSELFAYGNIAYHRFS